MATLWKQQVPLHPAFQPLNNCLREDWFLLPFELSLQRGHAVALRQAGILSEDEQVALTGALERLEQQYASADCPEHDAEDLHTWLEQRLTELAGAAGRKIHTARSRNDQVATLLKMYVIQAGQKAGAEMAGFIQTCCRRAHDWAELVFPLHTHTQFAAPGTVGFWVLRFATAMGRTRRLLSAHLAEWRRTCPLGSGAVAGSSIAIDRNIQAAELGFDGPSLNALDSTSTRDECLQWLFVAAQVGLHLQSLAADVIAFAQTPLSWARYPAAFGTGSSMMPNKTNPDAAELLRGEACGLLAAPSEAMLLLKGLPSGYNRDLQCIKPLVRRTTEKFTVLVELANALLAELEFDPQRLRASIAGGAIDATLIMEEQIKRGASLRDAHHAVAGALHEGTSIDTEDDPTKLVQRYATIGCASPAETRRVADELLAELM